MDKDEALELLNTGRISYWNDFRKRNPRWVPDLSGETLKGDLSYANLAKADLCDANLSQAKLHSNSDGYLLSENRTNLKDAKFNFETLFPKDFDPVDGGAMFVTKAEAQDDDRSRTQIFISYAWANDAPGLGIEWDQDALDNAITGATGWPPQLSRNDGAFTNW